MTDTVPVDVITDVELIGDGVVVLVAVCRLYCLHGLLPRKVSIPDTLPVKTPFPVVPPAEYATGSTMDSFERLPDQ